MQPEYVITLRSQARAYAERLRCQRFEGWEPDGHDVLTLLIEILDILVAQEQDEMSSQCEEDQS